MLRHDATHTHIGDALGRTEAHTNNAQKFSETKILRSKTPGDILPSWIHIIPTHEVMEIMALHIVKLVWKQF